MSTRWVRRWLSAPPMHLLCRELTRTVVLPDLYEQSRPLVLARDNTRIPVAVQVGHVQVVHRVLHHNRVSGPIFLVGVLQQLEAAHIRVGLLARASLVGHHKIQATGAVNIRGDDLV
jgi:hypothetical protein